MSQNRNEKSIIEVYRAVGDGLVTLADGSIRSVEVEGLIRKGRWWFIVHHDIMEPQYLTISEASTGFQLKQETYYAFEDALYFGLPFIDEKYFHIATKVGNSLVKTQRSLLSHNLTLRRAYAIL